MHILPDWLQIMHWLVNTGLDFSLKNLLYVHAEIILSSQGDIFYLDVYDITSLGILKGNLLKMFLLF